MLFSYFFVIFVFRVIDLQRQLKCPSGRSVVNEDWLTD